MTRELTKLARVSSYSEPNHLQILGLDLLLSSEPSLQLDDPNRARTLHKIYAFVDLKRDARFLTVPTERMFPHPVKQDSYRNYQKRRDHQPLIKTLSTYFIALTAQDLLNL
ncbi:hypothetical protein TNCV_4832691 [Trichonephila clavipes]|nr:hypothetical protein TNCV_4832691 [Trichonephila clavipes]